MRFMEAGKWAERRFDPESRPDRRTIAAWVESGDLPGRRLGKKLYIDDDAFMAAQTGDEMVDRVLAAGR